MEQANLIDAAAVGAGAINHLAERDIDARMSRTRGWPFVTGELSSVPLWSAVLAGAIAEAAIHGRLVAF